MSTGRVHGLIVVSGSGPGLLPVEESLTPLAGRALRDIWEASLSNVGAAVVRVAGRSESARGTADALAAHADLADGADDVLVVRSGYLTGANLDAFLKGHRNVGGPLTVLRNGVGADLGVYAFKADAYRSAAASGAAELASVIEQFGGPSGEQAWGGVHIDLGTQKGLAEARRVAGRVLAEALRPHRPQGRPAVFLDRDGTINVDVHYLTDPKQFRLVPGAGAAIRRLREAGFACVVVTNQSGVGRGMLTSADLDAIHEEMAARLDAEGTAVDATYACVEVPCGPANGSIEYLDRKPGPGMLYRAAVDLDLNLEESWIVGDSVSDIEAGSNAGCLGGFLVRTGRVIDPGATLPAGSVVVDDLSTAVDLILNAKEAEAKGKSA